MNKVVITVLFLVLTGAIGKAEELPDYHESVSLGIVTVVSAQGDFAFRFFIGAGLLRSLPKALEGCGKVELALEVAGFEGHYMALLRESYYALLDKADDTLEQFEIGDGRTISASQKTILHIAWNTLIDTSAAMQEAELGVTDGDYNCGKALDGFDGIKALYEELKR